MTSTLTWRRSSRSYGNNECIEVAEVPDAGFSVRDSKNPAGAVLTFTAAEWVAFTAGVRAGEFD